MRASEMGEEELAAFVESDAGRSYMEAADAEWDGVIASATEAGFVTFECGGMAVLCTYADAFENLGTVGVMRMLQVNGVEIPEDWRER